MRIVTVYLPGALTPDSTVERVAEALHYEALHNPDFSGTEFAISFDCSAWVDCSDEIAGASLLRSTIIPILEEAGL